MRPFIRIENREQLQANLRAYLKEVATGKQQNTILRAGGAVVRREAKKMIPKSSKEHFYQRKNIKVKILSGNLRNSLYLFNVTGGGIMVGPRVLRTLYGVKQIGDKPKNSSGYYSHMIYGDATAFRKKITEPALSNNLQKINDAMFNALNRITNRISRKYGLQ